MSTKSIVTRLSIFMLILTFVFAVPETAHATATGFAYWGEFTVNIGGQSVGIPSGQLAHTIHGTGYHIEWDAANFASAAVICDPSMRFTYGNGKNSVNGDVHWGCSRGGQWGYYLNWNAPRGDACAELWAKNWRVLVARQCHYVHGSSSSPPSIGNGNSGPSVCSSSLTRNLKEGMSGEDVAELQRRLNKALGIKLDVDGIFGQKTREAAADFQRLKRLEPVTGDVGPRTRAALDSIC